MIFLSSELFVLYQCFESIFDWIKYYFCILFSPIVENVIKSRFSKFGVTINGKNRWDLKVVAQDTTRVNARIATYYSLGVAEAYMDQSIEIEDLVEFCTRLLSGDSYKSLTGFNFERYFNLQTRSRAWEVGKKHYDLGNDLYEAMLDPWMQYTCGYWKNATTLEEAQIAKMDLIARKMMLTPGMRVLDIGCGFGSFAKYLAENYDVHVVGVTISEEQVKYANEHFAHPHVKILSRDYRDVDEKFDRIVSVGMFEHVGTANYSSFFKIVHQCLKDDGIFLLHSIGVNDKDFGNVEPFLNKYIFPNGILPRQNEVVKYLHGLFYIEDWHNFGYDYSKTLKAWDNNFQKAWPQLKSSYDQRFYRMWIFYLQSCTAAFITRKLNLWQLVLTKTGKKGGYTSVR